MTQFDTSNESRVGEHGARAGRGRRAASWHFPIYFIQAMMVYGGQCSKGANPATCSAFIPVIWPLSSGQPSVMVILRVKAPPEVADLPGCGYLRDGPWSPHFWRYLNAAVSAVVAVVGRRGSAEHARCPAEGQKSYLSITYYTW